VWQPVRANNLDDINRQIEELTRAREQSVAATKPLEAELGRLEDKLANIEAGIAKAKADLRGLEASIAKREVDFAIQYALLAERVESFYKASRAPSSFFVLFASGPSSNLARDLFYQQVVTDKDKEVITQISLDLIQLETDKKKVEEDKVRLADLQAKLDKEAEFFEGEIAGAKAYQADLGQQIASLTARQQSILAEKSGTFKTSVGDVPLADDYNASPAFSPGFSPAFAAFSFGAPHFKGMSQYGAFGRAKSNQGMEEILKAYYGNVRIETVDTNFNLPTTVGDLPFEDNYLKGIAEMPTSWADQGGYEALKAQAIAARSYALAYTDWRMGSRSAKKAICITENCQVYNAGKAGNPGKWGDAVKDTRGKIMVSNNSNEVINAWYASTSGGYQESYSSLGHSTPGFWDTANGRDGWTSQAYEKIGGSPWFYKGWYKSRSGDSCGRSHPWLTSEEMADILNGWVVLFQGGGDSSRVTPEGSCWGDNPYSVGELQAIGGYISVSDVSVTYGNNGVTASVTFQTNKGSTPPINGNNFYKAFNLRAPGRIALKSGLYNVERR